MDAIVPLSIFKSGELMARQPLIEKKARVLPFAAEWSQGNTSKLCLA